MCTQHIPNTNERNLTKLNILHHAVQVIMQLEDQVTYSFPKKSDQDPETIGLKKKRAQKVSRTFSELIEENRILRLFLSGTKLSAAGIV